MVEITKGCLVKTEESIKQLILDIGENENFVVADINDKCVFITEQGAVGLKSRIEGILNKSKDIQK